MKLNQKFNILISFVLSKILKLSYIFSKNSLKKRINEIENINDINLKLKKFQLLGNEYGNNPYFLFEFGKFCNVFFPEKSKNVVKNLESDFTNWANKTKKKNQRYIPIETVMGSLGNYWPLFYYLINEINFEKSKVKPRLVIRPHERINNDFLFKKFEKYLNVEKNTFSFFFKQNEIENLTLPISFMIKFQQKYYPFYEGMNLVNQKLYASKKNTFISLQLSDLEKQKGYDLLKTEGIDVKKGDWFVVLHVRETKNCLYRNADPNSYLKAIKTIINAGGKVIRVGDKNWLGSKITELPKLEGLIDYPFTKIKSKFMDIFLASACKFCIGTSSGYWTVASFFNKPILLTNFLPSLCYFALRKNDIFLPKTLIDKKTQKVVPLKKLFSLPFGWAGEDELYEDYTIIDNSSEEILKATNEMLRSLEEKKSLPSNGDIKEKKLKDELSKIHGFKLQCFAKISESFINRYH